MVFTKANSINAHFSNAIRLVVISAIPLVYTPPLGLYSPYLVEAEILSNYRSLKISKIRHRITKYLSNKKILRFIPPPT